MRGAAIALEFLADGGGDMAALIRSFDWSRTPLGEPETWSPALRTMVRILLVNRFPMLLWWGRSYIQIYNDAYRPIPGAKHPDCLGQPASECWSEIWNVIGPLIDTPFKGGPATWIEDLELEVNRAGFPEETHFTVAYSPVPDETAPNEIGGVLATVHEITAKIIGERRTIILRDLGARMAEAKTAEEACIRAAATLERNPKDLPFALLYLIAADGKQAHFAASSGLDGEITDIAPPIVELNDPVAPWPFTTVRDTGQLQVVENLGSKFAAVPRGPWANAPHRAAVVPIRSHLARQLSGFFVAGLSPRLLFDEAYSNFLELATAQIATALANAQAYEEERKRSEALAEIDRAKTAFFSNVSHEFRTPLTLMLGPLEEVLQDGLMRPENRERVTVAHRNSLRLLKLVNSLLDFSRIEAERVKASYSPVDLAGLTTDIASNFRSAMEAAGLEFIVDCEPLPEPVYVDREMWEKVVLNLLSNAFKFTFEGCVKVSIEARDNYAVLTVSDTGVGIPEAELPHIWERFHRVEGAKGRTYEGSGIGLALIQELVKVHGGSVEAKSRPGAGSTFTVSLPFGAAHLPRERIGSAMSREASTAVRVDAFTNEALTWLGHERLVDPTDAIPEIETRKRQVGPRPRIILADDNADMREHVAHILGSHYDLIAVRDGLAALDEARKTRPDLILSDVMMPVMDGSALLNELRSDENLREIPVILLSARAGEEARIDGLSAGADDYLSKPFSAHELRMRVAARLELHRIRKLAEQALRESEGRYRQLAEQISDGIFVADSQGRYVDANTAAAEMLRYTRDELLNLTLTDAIDPYEIQRLPEQYQALASGNIVRNDWRFRRKDGSTFTGELVGRQLSDGRFQGVLRDVTEHRRTERFQEEQRRCLEMIAYGRSTDECLRALTDSASRLIANARAGVLLAGEARAKIENILAGHIPASLGEGIRGVPINELLIGTFSSAIYSGKAVICADIANDERWSKPWRELCAAHGVLSAYSTPVFGTDGKAVASFVLCFSEAREPEEWERQIAEFGAHIAGIILEREKVSKDLRQTQSALETELSDIKLLQAISAELIDSRNEAYLYRKIIDAAVVVMRSDFASLQMFSSEGQNGEELRLIGFHGFNPSAARFWQRVHPDSKGSCGVALNTRQRVIVADIEQCDFMVGTADLTTFRETGIRAMQTTPLFSRSGKLLGMISTHWREKHEPTERDLRLLDIIARQAADLIERKHSTEALRKSDERFRFVAETSQVGHWDWNIVANRLEWDPVCKKLFGIPENEEMSYERFLTAIHSEDRDRTDQAVRTYLESAGAADYDIEYRCQWLDGSVHWIRAKGAAIFDSGKAVRMAGIAIDITASRRDREALREGEAKLRESEAQFRNLADAMPQLCWMAYGDGHIFWYNGGWYRYTGTTFEQMEGWGWRSVHDPEVLPSVMERWTTAIRTGEPFEMVFPLKGADGRFRPFLTRIIPVHDTQGSVVRWFGTNTDVSELKRVEDELRDANVNLQQFAYSASHDLQEPARTVKIYSELLETRYRTKLDDQAKEFLDHVQKGASRLEALLRDLLVYTQTNRSEKPAELINTSEAVEPALASLAGAIQESGARVTFDPMPSVRAHPLQLQQIFQNLIGNAIKYRRPGQPPVVHITARRENGYWLFAVSDNGIGIDPEFKDHIFGLFKRLHAADKYPGTGIGLALCKRIVDLYDGRIWVESELGKGSTFYFTLPA